MNTLTQTHTDGYAHIQASIHAHISTSQSNFVVILTLNSVPIRGKVVIRTPFSNFFSFKM